MNRRLAASPKLLGDPPQAGLGCGQSILHGGVRDERDILVDEIQPGFDFRQHVQQPFAEILERTLQTVRGTVQADILKEDQGQNTCIFSIDFALKMMGDIQEYFIEKNVRNFYSVSISGYHIREAGATAGQELAYTLLSDSGGRGARAFGIAWKLSGSWIAMSESSQAPGWKSFSTTSLLYWSGFVNGSDS